MCWNWLSTQVAEVEMFHSMLISSLAILKGGKFMLFLLDSGMMIQTHMLDTDDQVSPEDKLNLTLPRIMAH